MERENTVEILRNGEENKINIPITVINELDGLVKNNHKRPKAMKVVENLLEHKEYINFVGDVNTIVNNDDRILKSIESDDATLVTNDKIMQLKSYICGIESEEFKESIPFQSDSQRYTGFIDIYNNEEYIPNCFYFKEGKLFHYIDDKEKCIDYKRNP
jgi:PhoH-like ATPase